MLLGIEDDFRSIERESGRLQCMKYDDLRSSAVALAAMHIRASDDEFD
jgi:hypothetical protein